MLLETPGDRRLCETSEERQALPSFSYRQTHWIPEDRLNVLFVVLNTETKFRQYRAQPPETTFGPLPDDVLHLMDLTCELADLPLYFCPWPAEGSPGAAVAARDIAYEAARAASEDSSGKTERRRRTNKPLWPWPEGADLQTRMAIGRALISGYGVSRLIPLHGSVGTQTFPDCEPEFESELSDEGYLLLSEDGVYSFLPCSASSLD